MLRNRKFLKNVDPITIRDSVPNISPPLPSRMEAEEGNSTETAPTSWDPTPSPGLVTPPRPARTPARRRSANPSPEVTDAGGDRFPEVISNGDWLEVTEAETSGEAESGPRRDRRTRKKPSYLEDFIQ